MQQYSDEYPSALAICVHRTLEYDHPIAGRIRQPRPAARFDQTPSGIQRPAPGLGEHSAEILTELGYAEEDIARLVAQGVLGVMVAPE